MRREILQSFQDLLDDTKLTAAEIETRMLELTEVVGAYHRLNQLMPHAKAKPKKQRLRKVQLRKVQGDHHNRPWTDTDRNELIAEMKSYNGNVPRGTYERLSKRFGRTKDAICFQVNKLKKAGRL